jgi:hypothetical protein
MAQSATTCTPANPTPPTNLSYVGNTPPLDPAQAVADDGVANTYPVISQNEGGGVNGSTNPSAVGNKLLFAAKTAAANTASAPGAGISNDGEARGTEVSVTASVPNPSPAGQLIMTSTLGNYTTSPNAQHASSLSPATNPTLSTIAPTTAVSGTGTVALTAVTGVGFTKQSVVYANGVAQPTVFVSSTTLTATMTKKATSGTWPITVVTGGVVTTTAQTFTWT